MVGEIVSITLSGVSLATITALIFKLGKFTQRSDTMQNDLIALKKAQEENTVISQEIKNIQEDITDLKAKQKEADSSNQSIIITVTGISAKMDEMFRRLDRIESKMEK